MRTPRLAASAAVVAVLALAPAATGAGKVCHLVTDRKGDQQHVTDSVPGRPVPVSSDLDIVGGDIATNKRYVTAVVRLATLRENDTEAPAGRAYELQFNVGARTFALSATYGRDGYGGSAQDVTDGAGIGDAGVIIDHAAREVRITAPASYFGIKNGVTITRIKARSASRYGTNSRRSTPSVNGYGMYVGGAGMESHTDDGFAASRYVAGTPSCVSVAR